jgi:type VI secretion system protein ImpH
MGAEDREFDAGIASAAGEPASTGPQVAAASPPEYDGAEALDQPLANVLWSEPFRFEFFAALRVLARMAQLEPRSGDDPRSAIDRVQFRALQSLSFPPSEIWDIKKLAGGERLAEMTVAFLGLTGPMGALPRPYSELVMQRVRKGDYVLRDFLDVFNHRLLTIFAKAGEKYRFYLTHELAAARERWRRTQGPQKLRGFLIDERPRIDLFSQVLLDLSGTGTPLLRYKDSVRGAPAPRTEVADETMRYFGGALAQSHRCAVSLGRVLGEFLQVSAEIVPFVGQWVPLPLEYQTCMRRSDPVGAAAEGTRPRAGLCSQPRLGQNTVVGSRIWEVQGRFRVRLGPLKFEQFQHFLPVGGKFRRLAHLTRLYAGPTFDFDVQPVLQGAEVPWCQLGTPGARAPRLGWNTWLRNKPFTQPVDDAIFRVPDSVSMAE